MTTSSLSTTHSTRMGRSNIVFLEHINFTQPDQRLATAFYVAGLGFTRDPYLMVGLENMWVNVGRSQIHLPSRAPDHQNLPGSVGLVVPAFRQLTERLERVRPWLAGTAFAYEEKNGAVMVTCPWGNRFECHAPSPAFGPNEIALAYINVDVKAGTVPGIGRFYREVIGAEAEELERDGAAVCRVRAGQDQWIDFIETQRSLPAYDGHHIQIYIDDFAGPGEKLQAMGLITQTNGQDEWRFVDIVDPLGGACLHRLEHEVRSLRHPLCGRMHVNRDPAVTVASYRHGRGPLQF